jgi:inner membrane transporter RhtA
LCVAGGRGTSTVACAQAGAAVARTLFDELGVLLIRMGAAAPVFAVVVRPRVRAWPAAAWWAAALLGACSAGLTMLSYLAFTVAPQGIVVTLNRAPDRLRFELADAEPA